MRADDDDIESSKNSNLLHENTDLRRLCTVNINRIDTMQKEKSQSLNRRKNSDNDLNQDVNFTGILKLGIGETKILDSESDVDEEGESSPISPNAP